MGTENVTKLPLDYIIEEQIIITIPRVGYQILNLGVQWVVRSGYRLAFYSKTENDVIALSPVRFGETFDFYSKTNIIDVGTTLLAQSFSPIKGIHHISAIAKPLSNINMK